MTPEQKAKQMAEAIKMLGPKHPELVREYQHIFLKNSNGRTVLKDVLRDTKVFTLGLKESDLPLRNYGVKLMYTIAGAHITPETLDSLFGMFIDALAEYELRTVPKE